MSSTEGPFQPMDFTFNPNGMHPFSYDSDANQVAMSDPTIMWGGMSQMSLDQGIPQGIDPTLFNNPQQAAYSINKHGQITPPNDDDELSFMKGVKREDEVSQKSSGSPSNGSSVASSKPKRAASKRKAHHQKDTATPSSDKPKKSTRKARKGYKATTKEEEDDLDGEMKRERFLERNRVAASKCRQKKKEWTNGLEGHARDLAAANAQLNACVLSLKEEVLYLKSECLKHTDCECDRIREYLDRSIAGMNPSGVMGTLRDQRNMGSSRRFSEGGESFQGITPPEDEMGYSAESRTGSVSVGSAAMDSPEEMPATSEQDMQALLEASIAMPDGSGGSGR